MLYTSLVMCYLCFPYHAEVSLSLPASETQLLFENLLANNGTLLIVTIRTASVLGVSLMVEEGF